MSLNNSNQESITQAKQSKKENLLLPTIAEHEQSQRQSIVYHKHELEDKKKYGKTDIARARAKVKEVIERVKQEIQNEQRQIKDRKEKLKDIKKSYSDYIKELREEHKEEYNIIESEDSRTIN